MARGRRWSRPYRRKEAGGADAIPTTLNLKLIRELLAVIDVNRRGKILDSAETFDQFVHQETLNQAVLTAAFANGADQNEAIGVLMARAAHRILAEAYLNQVVRLNLDRGFPTDDQVREAYDNNTDAFRIPERIHLWQIFMPLADGASDDDFKAAWKLVDRIAADLRTGKANFAAMAKKHSGHEASRVNDGYMGLVKVAELLPAIAEASSKLGIDGISQPIATATGLHIIRKGATVAAELLAFERVKNNIRQRLRREAAQKVRQAAVEKISQEFPVSAPKSDLESWRATLVEEAKTAVVQASAATEP